MLAAARVQEAVAALYDFHTRARGKRRLLAEGEAAVPVVAAELETARGAAIRWVLLNLLGEIGSTKALRHVEPFLTHPDLAQVARDAVRRIRSARGETAEETAPATPPPHAGAAPAGATLREIAQEAMKGFRCVFVAVEDGRELDLLVYLQGGRVQHVKLRETETADGVALVTVYTECGPARRGAYEWALRSNFSLGFGGFALREARGELVFCVSESLPRAGLDPRLLGSVVRSFAERGDFLEKRLAAADTR